MPKKDKVTTEGGGRGYHMVRSKIAKGKDGYGKVITQEREAMLERLGKDPGPDTVAMHKDFGAHHSKKIEAWKVGTRAENTAESNRNRKTLSEKVKDKWKMKKG